ncbi:MAG: polysaccharide biosynthesis tyrosine autokinase [Chloroflexota bacterium]|nr:polysaccharide biosynthesis tyrosine autokinase [Chloroflexota bacterium]
MDIRKAISLLKKWFWLPILGALIAGSLGYYQSSRETPMFQASTRFVVLRAASTGYYDYYAYIDYQQLISTYTQLLSTDALLAQVSEAVGFPVYAGQANAEQIAETQFVRLTVTHEDPVKASSIANALVNVLIDQNEQLQSVRYETTEQNLQNRADQAFEQMIVLQDQIVQLSVTKVEEQITQVQTQIDDLQTQVTDLEFKITNIDPLLATEEESFQILQYQAELNQIQPLLELYQQIYIELIVVGEPMEREDSASSQMARIQRTLSLYEQIYFNSINSLETLNMTRVQSAPNVIQVEPAVIPANPISPRPMETAALFGGVGFLLMAGIIFLVEYLDDTIKTPDEAKDILNLPVIGLIADMNSSSKKSHGGNKGIFVIDLPRSPITEAFRSIRTSLEFYSVDQPLQILVVTSSGSEEGKTTIATNLAAILAKGDKNVLLLDADLRRPNIHNLFGISNRTGLSDLLRGRLTIPEIIQKFENLENLSVITSGSLPPNPAELIASKKMSHIIQNLQKQFEFIVIDTPPAIVTDSQLLASLADGVIYIVRPGKTRVVAAKTPLAEFERVGANLIGVVMNRIPRNRAYYYGGYDYYAPNGHSSEKYYRFDDQDRSLIHSKESAPENNQESSQPSQPAIIKSK